MKRIPKRILELPLHERALIALREASRKAIAEHQRLGIPAWVLEDGEIVDATLPRKLRHRSKDRPRAKRQ